MKLKVAIIEDFCISLQRIEGKACFAKTYCSHPAKLPRRKDKKSKHQSSTGKSAPLAQTSP